MASHRRSKVPSRARIAFLTAAAATTVALTATAAQAAPQQTTGELKAQIDKLNNDADVAVQKYDQVQSDQQALQKQVNTLQDQVARQQASVSAKSAALGSVASAQYRDGSIDPTVQLMLSTDPTDYLNQASAQSQLSSSQANMLAQLKTAQTTLNNEKADAEGKLKQLDATSRQLAASKTVLQQKLDAAKAKLDSLTASQAAALKAAQDAADAGAKAGAAKDAKDSAHRGGRSSSNSGSQSGGSSGSSGSTGSNAAGSSVGMAALAAAETKEGDPYQRAGTGPHRWDCSGLTQWAFAQAGVSIGRTTYDQINMGTPVTLADIQIGDLVFFNGNSHVGIYAGGGRLFHAPHTGTVVKFETMSEVGTIYGIRHI